MPELLDKKGLTEEEFLRQYDPDKYPKPSVTADIVVFRERGDTPEVLLIRRGGHPFLGRWAFPGGFAERNERIERTAERELMEETGVTGIDMKLVGVYRLRPDEGLTPDARGCVLAFDHDEILADAVRRIYGD